VRVAMRRPSNGPALSSSCRSLMTNVFSVPLCLCGKFLGFRSNPRYG
jgi:hypothetical protein